MERRTGIATVAALVLALGTPAVMAQDETGWTHTAELSYVATDGNSEATSLGLSDLSRRQWAKSRFTVKLDAIRAETTDVVDRFAIETPPSVVTIEETTTTAERYLVEARYDRNISEKLFWFAGTSWDRNRPSGIEDRYQGFAGVGNIWWDTDDLKFRTDYAVSYTDQTDVVVDPAADDSFVGLRFSWEYRNKFGESTQYGNDFIVDYSLDESDDWRMDMTNFVAVAMNKRLALKVSLQFLYDHMPPRDLIPVFDMDPNAGGTQTGTTFFEKDDLDTIFKAGLVVNF